MSESFTFEPSLQRTFLAIHKSLKVETAAGSAEQFFTMFRKFPFDVLKFTTFLTSPNHSAFFFTPQTSIPGKKNIFVWVLLKTTFRQQTSHFPSSLFYSPSTITLPVYDKLLKIEFRSVPLGNFDGFPIPSNLVSVSTHNVNDRRFPPVRYHRRRWQEVSALSEVRFIVTQCLCQGEKISIARCLRCRFRLSRASHHFSVTARREIDFSPI